MLNWTHKAGTGIYAAGADNGDMWTIEDRNGNYVILDNGKALTHRRTLKAAKTWAQLAANHRSAEPAI